jgi:hypothetical protein
MLCDSSCISLVISRSRCMMRRSLLEEMRLMLLLMGRILICTLSGIVSHAECMN